MKPKLIDKIKANIVHSSKVHRTPWKFWPSEASCELPDGTVIGSCIRRLYYQWTDTKVTDPTPEWVRNLAHIGNFLEEKTRQECKKKKIYPEELNKKENRKFKIPLFKDGVLSGEVDIFIEDEEEHAVIEVKSYSNSTYKIKVRPKDNHLLQAFLYCYFVEPKTDYVLLYYRPSMISKYAEEDVYHKINFEEVDGEVYPVINGQIDKRISINGIVKRFKEAKYYIENKTLPKREFTKSSKNCQYCPYKTFCWKGPKGTKLGE